MGEVTIALGFFEDLYTDKFFMDKAYEELAFV